MRGSITLSILQSIINLSIILLLKEQFLVSLPIANDLMVRVDINCDTTLYELTWVLCIVRDANLYYHLILALSRHHLLN